MATPLDVLVSAFNALPTIKTLPTEVKNHWHFALRRVSLDSPDDVLHLVNPGDGFTHVVGPRELRGLVEEDKINAIVRLLLESFVKGMPRWLSTEVNGVIIPRHQPVTRMIIDRNTVNTVNTDAASNPIRFAPWTWSTDDAELGRAVAERMKEIGVNHKRLTKVVRASARDEVASLCSFVKFQGALMKDMTKIIVTSICNCPGRVFPPFEADKSTSPCDRCGKLLDITPIARAAAGEGDKQRHSTIIEQTENASIGLPREDKAISKENEGNVETDDNDATVYNPYPENDYQNPLEFYNNIPHTLQEACDLADSIGLILPQGDGGDITHGIVHPIRRLIITGEDTPTNMILLLGPRWQETAQQLYDDHRMAALLCPAVGSPNYAYYRRFDSLDRPAPYKRPRPPSAAERAKLNAVYTMQHMVKEELKNERREPSRVEMTTVCTRYAGPRWEEELDMSVWQLAVKSLDQGIQLHLDL